MTDTPTQMLQQLHKIAATAPSEAQFEKEVRLLCSFLADRIQDSKGKPDAEDSRSNRSENDRVVLSP